MALETLNDIVVTKGGWPAMWERGGALSRRGSATIVAEPDGSKPRPILIRTRGHLACGQHALVGLRAGMYVISAGRSGAVDIKRIKRLGVKNQKALVEVEEVDASTIPSELQPAVQAAVKKGEHLPLSLRCLGRQQGATALRSESSPVGGDLRRDPRGQDVRD